MTGHLRTHLHFAKSIDVGRYVLASRMRYEFIQVPAVTKDIG
ncbi:hypothetical protein BLA50215_04952 [Burkholderia lata]|nr:hypothetical protein BLA50215_04952 [Burkholderia lata]